MERNLKVTLASVAFEISVVDGRTTKSVAEVTGAGTGKKKKKKKKPFFLHFPGGHKKGNRGPSFKISPQVSVLAKSVIQAAQDLEPLAKAIPLNKDKRKQ